MSIQYSWLHSHQRGGFQMARQPAFTNGASSVSGNAVQRLKEVEGMLIH
jgi:hypothetical protein